MYWGNRNWHPFLEDTVREMADAGVERAIAFVTSAYSSYSACRQYYDDIDRAVAAVGPRAPRIDKIRPYFNHPGFIEPWAAAVADALATLDRERAASAWSTPRTASRRGWPPPAAATRPERGWVGRAGGRGRPLGRPGAQGSLKAYLRTDLGRLCPVRPRLSESQRPAERALARAGCQRAPGPAGQGRRVRGRGGAGRVRQRPHGGRARPGRGGGRDRGLARPRRSPGRRPPGQPRGSPGWCASWWRSGPRARPRSRWATSASARSRAGR